MSKGSIIALSVAILAGVLFFGWQGFRIGQHHPLISPIEPTETIVDTLYVHDTTLVKEPVFVDRVKTEKVLVPADTIRVRDTLYVALDKERIEWRDSLCSVYASGVQVSVDSVRHYERQVVITTKEVVPVKVRSRWGVGVNAGYGATINGQQVALSPYIGIGISYNILSW